MDNEIIKRLAHLTTSFYQKTARDFSQSRSAPWAGWNNLLPSIGKITTKPIRVLDIACGNGRFAHFLAQKCPDQKFVYVGIDNNQQLLHDATKKSRATNIVPQLLTVDITQCLLENKPLVENQPGFDLVVAFGILHHIPSNDLRERFFCTLAQHCSEGGYCVVTFWDFIQAKRLEKKRVEPNLLGFEEKELESGDYILDWQRGTAALRYVNHLSLKDRYRLVKISGLKLVEEFRSDGKEHNLNHYLVLQK